MRRCLRAASVPIVLAWFLTGCGSGETERTGAANASRRYGEKYKHLIKDGKPIWRPGMPKKLPSAKSKPKAAAG